MSRTVLVIAALLLAGCAEAPSDAPPTGGASDAPVPEAPAPAQQPPAVPSATLAWAAAERASREDLAAIGVTDAPLLFTVEPIWFPSASESGDPLLPPEMMPKRFEVDPSAVPFWEFTYMAGDWASVVLASHEGEVVRTDVWYMGLGGFPDNEVVPAWSDPALAFAAMQSDPVARPFLASATNDGDWGYLGPTGTWRADFVAPDQRQLIATWSPTKGLEREVREATAALAVVGAMALRDAPDGDVTALAFDIKLVPGADPEPIGSYGFGFDYVFPGPAQGAIPGNAAGYYKLEWLRGDGEDDRIGEGDVVRLTYPLAGHALPPGQQIAIRLNDVDRATHARFELPATFGDALELPLTT